MTRAILALSIVLLASAVPAAAGGGSPVPAFADETASSGIDSVYSGEWEYMVGGGVASFDCDGDRFPDLYFAGGDKPGRLFRNKSKAGGALAFETAESGLEIDAVTGAWPLDIDADGVMDLALTRVGENLLMRGEGGCRFTRANERFGFDGGDAWSAAFAAMWEKGNSLPTLAIGNYIDRKAEDSPWGSCTDNWLHRPDAAGSKYRSPHALKPSWCALSMLFTDWNRSGEPALRISNDREYYEGGQEQLWRMQAGRDPAEYSEAEGWRPLVVWGMGLASADLDGDAKPEFFITSMADNKLQALAAVGGAPTYRDIAYARGVTAHRPHVGDDLKPSTAWHAQFEDANNDGLADLLVVKGNVDSMPDFAARDPDNLLIQTPSGKFEERSVEAGVAGLGTGRGAAFADLNLDGLVDLVVVNRREKASVYRNTTANAGNFLAIEIAQHGVNRNAIGAWIEVRREAGTTTREVTVGGGHASGQAGFAHFGLGDAKEATVRVQWPDGEWSAPFGVKANSFVTLTRRAKEIRSWSPGQ